MRRNLENLSSSQTRCLVIGTRAPVDHITYPEHDRVCLRDRSVPTTYGQTLLVSQPLPRTSRAARKQACALQPNECVPQAGSRLSSHTLNQKFACSLQQ